MMRQFREDIAQLLQNGQHRSAFARVQELHKYEHILLAYDQVLNFCDCVLNNIDEITNERKLSGDVREAVSSLIFAASRSGDLPELQSLRYFFIGIFGRKFERANVELLPGNRVNSELKHSLSIKSVPETVKNQIVNEILRKVKLNLVQPIKVQEPTFSEDGSDGVKDQNQTKKYVDMLPEIDPTKSVFKDCENMATFSCNSQDGSDGIASPFFRKETNKDILPVKNDEDFATKNRTNGKLTNMDGAFSCCHDKKEQPLQRGDSSRADQFKTVDIMNGLRTKASPYLKAVNRNCGSSPVKESSFTSKETNTVVLQEKHKEGFIDNGEQPLQIQDSLRGDQFTVVNSSNRLRVSGPPYWKAVREKSHVSIRNDLKYSTIHPSASVITAESSPNDEEVGRDECGYQNGVIRDQSSPSDRRAYPKSPHVHPKLPEYDDLVVQIRNLKERASRIKF